jgi:hypothetical protein
LRYTKCRSRTPGPSQPSGTSRKRWRCSRRRSIAKRPVTTAGVKRCVANRQNCALPAVCQRCSSHRRSTLGVDGAAKDVYEPFGVWHAAPGQQNKSLMSCWAFAVPSRIDSSQFACCAACGSGRFLVHRISRWSGIVCWLAQPKLSSCGRAARLRGFAATAGQAFACNRELYFSRHR